MSNTNTQISELIEKHRVIVCCGSGGVGKTTTSAALAMQAALMGKRVVVITIDPAKRLATSLGLTSLSPDASDLTEHLNQALKENGAKKASGSFFAVMPDSQQTFETFVRAMAGANQNMATRVLKTSVYKIFTKEFSGTNEYMAMEKLYQLYNEDRFDLIVLDTPPSANTRLFLEAPQMLADFFDDKVIRWIITPGSKILAAGVKKVLELLEKLTGQGFISELIEFTTALFELRAQFTTNLAAVGELLHQKNVAFLMVTSPERLSKQDTQDFVSILKERDYRFWGFIVNRVLSMAIGTPINADTKPTEYAATLKGFSAHEIKVMEESFRSLEPTLQHEKEAARFLESVSGKSGHIVMVPEQPQDVHSVSALLKLSQDLAR